MLGIAPPQQRLGADDRAIVDASRRADSAAAARRLRARVRSAVSSVCWRSRCSARFASRNWYVLRPSSFDRYIATSACFSSSSGSSESSGIHGDADRRRDEDVVHSISNGCAIASSSFCAIRPSADGSSKSSTITMNSSPPSRASRSVSRSALDDSAARHPLQQLVADAMAERVVDVLEAVEIDEQHADAAVRCAWPSRSPASGARAAATGSGSPVSASRVARYCSRSSAWIRDETSCTNDRIETIWPASSSSAEWYHSHQIVSPSLAVIAR